jgi:hypothetical protein
LPEGRLKIDVAFAEVLTDSPTTPGRRVFRQW